MEQCLNLAKQTEVNALFLLLYGIFRDMYEIWYEQPLLAEKVKEVESMLIPYIINALENRDSLETLNELAKIYIQNRPFLYQAIVR